MPYVPLVRGGEPQYVLPFVNKKRLIEIGGGKNPIIRPNVDILPSPTVDIVHDLSVFPWSLKTGEYDGIFSQYCIEHVEWRKTLDFIKELYRILSPDGTATVITANLLEQCKTVVKDGVNQGTVERIFGSQEFPNYGGCHKCGLSPEYASELFKKAGFNAVKILPHPASSTDMIIEAYKMKDMFEREYFEDGTTGYREYRDFCTHYSTARFIAKMKPESVLDAGCGRGYVVRVLENEGIKATGMDTSNHCLPKGEKIISSTGLQNIENLKTGDFVISHDGKSHKILQIFKRYFDGDIIEIHVSGYDIPLRITPEHPIYSLVINNMWKRPSRIKKWDPIWLEAKELSKDDYIVFSIPCEIQDITEIDKPFYIKKARCYNKLLDKIKTPVDFFELAGYYLSEGTTGKYAIKFCFNITEKNLSDRVQYLLKQLFNLSSRVETNIQLHQRNVIVSSGELQKFMIFYFGKNAENKHLPEKFLNLPLDKQKAIIKGVWLGDGHIGIQNLRGKKYARASWASISRVQAEQIRILLLRCGIVNSLRTQKEKGTHKPSYHIRVTDQNSIKKLCKIIGKYPKGASRTKKTFRKLLLKEGKLYQHIKIEIKKFKGDVYNLEIEKSNSYSLPMATVHNCFHTRATDSFILWDVTKTPWPFSEKIDVSSGQSETSIVDARFDLCFSNNLLEHIPEKAIDAVIQEMVRVSKRGLHAIHYTDSPYKENDKDIDITHVSMHEKSWWENKFKSVAPDYPVRIEYPRTIEYENPYQQPPTSIAPGVSMENGQIRFIDNLNKLNLGSYKNCFYYGWINVDILDLKQFADQQSYRFRQVDLSKGIPTNSDSVDIIFHSHLLEHFSREEGLKFLKECWRVLKPSGIIRISVPDANLIVHNYINKTIKDYRYINVGVENAEDDAEALYELLMANHKTMYDEKALVKLLEGIGFKDVRRESPFSSRLDAIRKQTINTFPSISLVIEAQK